MLTFARTPVICEMQGGELRKRFICFARQSFLMIIMVLFAFGLYGLNRIITADPDLWAAILSLWIG